MGPAFDLLKNSALCYQLSTETQRTDKISVKEKREEKGEKKITVADYRGQSRSWPRGADSHEASRELFCPSTEESKVESQDVQSVMVQGVEVMRRTL